MKPILEFHATRLRQLSRRFIDVKEREVESPMFRSHQLFGSKTNSPSALSYLATKRTYLVSGLLAVATLLSTGCEKKEVVAPPPPDVEVVEVVQKDVPITKEWVATLDGFVNAQIRAQVSGYLLKQVYTNGAFVRKGAPLFQIDPRPFQAAVEQAKGNVEQAKGNLQVANGNLQVAEAKLGQDSIRCCPLYTARQGERDQSTGTG